jgi:sugar lactone lactonase YvrE
MKKLYILIPLIFLFNIAKSQYVVSTYSGNGTPALVNGNIDTAQFNKSFGICKDKFGNIFIADGGNNCIRKITTAGDVSTYAGSTTPGYQNGNATSALFNQPTGVCVDDSGNVYVADFNNQRIRKINTLGIVSTIAGSGIAGYNDAVGLLAQFNYPRGICIDKNYNIYVGDSWNHRVRKITLNGNVTTYAGGGTTIGVQSVGAYLDAPDTSARFYTPCGVSVDETGNVFVADAYNHRIRKIDTLRIVSTIIGSGPTGSGQGGFLDGSALSSRLNVPTEVFVDSLGNLYIGDTFNNRVRKMSGISGNVLSIGGNGTPGFVNGVDSLAEFNFPRGLIAFNDGRVYVNDYNNNRVRLIIPANTGINNLDYSNLINVYPNPTTKNITIETIEKSTIEVLNIQGQILKSIISENTSTTIDLLNFSSGIYFIKATSEKGIGVRKFIKE